MEDPLRFHPGAEMSTPMRRSHPRRVWMRSAEHLSISDRRGFPRKLSIYIVITIAIASLLFVASALNPFVTTSTDRESFGGIEVGPLAPVGGARSLDDTIRVLQAAVRAGSTEQRAALGLAYLQKARSFADPTYYSKATGLFDLALADDPRDQAALIGKALVANGQHRFALSLRYARRAIRINSYEADALGVAADSLIELGRYPAAATTLQKMLDLRPDVASFSRTSYYRELHGDLSGAISAMRDALASTQLVGDDAAWVRTQLGDLMFTLGAYDRAERLFRSAIEVGSEPYQARVGIARVDAARGDLARAARRMSRVASTYPSPANIILLHDLYVAAGRSSRAIDQRTLLDAQMRLFAAQRVVPDVEVTLFYADHGLRRGWNVKAARRQYEARPSVRTADALAWALHAAGRDRRAAPFVSQALRLGTRDPLTQYHAGVVLLSAGRRAAGRAHLRTALAQSPQFSVLHANNARRLLRSTS